MNSLALVLAVALFTTAPEPPSREAAGRSPTASVINVRQLGAIADGLADDTAALQAAITLAVANGGGTVLVPSGRYRTTSALELKSGVMLLGEGYGSWIENVATSGFSKNAIVTGNTGDIGGVTDMRRETKHAIAAVQAGATSITFIHAGDAASFRVGDIVALMSHEVWPDDKRVTQGNDLNVVVGITGGTLHLQYPVPDALPTISGNPSIARLSGSIKGYDGKPGWMAQRAAIRNLRVSNRAGLASSWYALFLNGVGIDVEDVWADNSGGVIGSNALSHSTIRNVRASFDLRGLDMADFQIANTLSGLELIRFGLNSTVGPKISMGIGIYAGADVLLDGSHVDLGGYGQVSFLHVHRGRMERNIVRNSGYGTNVSVLAGYGWAMRVVGNTIENAERAGIYVVGNGAEVLGNTVVGAGKSGRFYAIQVRAGVSQYRIENNTCGVAGAWTPKDRIVALTTGPDAVVRNNVTADSTPGRSTPVR